MPPLEKPTGERLLELAYALTEEQIIGVLGRRANPGCPTCGKNDWSMVPPSVHGAVALPLQKSPTNTVLGAPSIPVATMTCLNCGFVRMHNVMLLASKLLEDGYDPDKK